MIYTSGFFKRALKKAIKKQVIDTLRSKRANSRKETPAEREAREKQKLADDIRKQAKEQAQQQIKIMQDCVKLVNTTVNPEVFFYRYILMLEQLEALAGLESTGIFANSRELPSEAFLRVEKQFDDETKKFLDRSFEKEKKRADTLKTDSGKKNAIKRYFDNMDRYTIHMSNEGFEHYDKMKEANNIY